MEHYLIFLSLAVAFGIFMAWGIGANDVANAMGTSVGAKALTLKQAIIVAAVFEFAGAVLAGGEVTSTIRKGIVDAELLEGSPELLIYGMLAALLAAATWLLLATQKGWPVSTTHSIVGAVVGFAAVGLGFSSVHWDQVGTIAASWVVSPLLAGSISFFLFRTVQWLILDRSDPLDKAKRWVPAYIFLVGFILTLVTLKKGLKNLGIDLTSQQVYLAAAGVGVLIAIIGALFIRRIQPKEGADKEFRFHTVERVFGILMVVTACAMAFAHGSNDVANAVGPLAAVVSVAKTGVVTQSASMPIWILLVGGVGIVVGLATLGWKVMATIGEKITHLTPSRGFAAELAASSTIVIASATGLPVSTTHTLVGAVLGVGMARGIGAIDLRVVGKIFLSWIVTIPAGAILAVIFFYIFKFVFG